MQLTRCKDQDHETLEESYGELARSADGFNRECGEAMLGLLARLRALPGEKPVFGLTSHHRLLLLAEDSHQSPSFVIVSALCKHEYHIEALLPESTAPWPGAYVRGVARTEDEAVEMIETAMTLSEGWDSP